MSSEPFWLRIARPMCDGRSFASSPFRRLASRGLPFGGFPGWWTFQFAIYLARFLSLHDSVPRTIRAGTLTFLEVAITNWITFNNYIFFRGQFELDDNIDHRPFTKSEHLELWLLFLIMYHTLHMRCCRVDLVLDFFLSV